MSEKDEEKTRKRHHRDGYAGSPITQPMRTEGQRRRDAEVKLEHHLKDARHKDNPRDENAVEEEEPGAVNSHDAAATQKDDRDAADRVD